MTIGGHLIGVTSPAFVVARRTLSMQLMTLCFARPAPVPLPCTARCNLHICTPSQDWQDAVAVLHIAVGMLAPHGRLRSLFLHSGVHAPALLNSLHLLPQLETLRGA